MAPSFTRVTAGACLVLTGLFAGSSAVALANPDTQDDGGSNSQSANPGSNRKPAKPGGSIGDLSGHGGKATANSVGKTPGRHATAISSPASSTNTGDSVKGPSANAVANVPDVVPGAATAVSAVESVPGAIRQVLPTGASTVPSATPGAMVPLTMPGDVAGTGPLSGVLAPIGNLVENVANALGTGQIIEPFMNVANTLLEASVPGTSDGTTTRDGRTVHLPTAMPVAPVNDRFEGPQPLAVAPSTSLIGISTTAARNVAPESVSPTVMTPRLLSNQVNFAASQPPAVSPATPPVAQGWISGIATQIFHGVREALRNVTLTELALAALPGAAGLLFFFATGIGLGHRQAKFGFVMATSGSVRFAVRGPLGVVRSGSVVAVHSRKAAVAKEAAVAEQTTEQTPKGRRHLRVADSAA